jgi:hypothetical protein
MEPQFGSGSALLGGTSAIQEAMKRRGVDASVLNQVSPASGMPGANVLPTSAPAPLGNMAQMPPQGQDQGQGLPTGSSEAELIIKALAQRLKDLTKLGK